MPAKTRTEFFLIHAGLADATYWTTPPEILQARLTAYVGRFLAANSGGPMPETEVSAGNWFCLRCHRLWFCQGSHPDCNGEAQDMVKVRG